MSFDEIFHLTTGVYFYFYNNSAVQTHAPRAGDTVREWSPHDPRVFSKDALALGWRDAGLLPQKVKDATQPVHQPDRLESHRRIAGRGQETEKRGQQADSRFRASDSNFSIPKMKPPACAIRMCKIGPEKPDLIIRWP